MVVFHSYGVVVIIFVGAVSKTVPDFPRTFIPCHYFPNDGFTRGKGGISPI